MGRLYTAALRFFLIGLLPAWSGVHHVQAQKPLERDYVIQFAGMEGRDQEKVALSAIKDQDPSAVISVDLPSQRLKVRTWAELDRAMIETRITPFGLSVVSLGPLFPLGPTERSMHNSGPPGFPEFVDTGNPANDEAVYQTNKAAWIIAHPDLYPPAQNDVAPAPE